MENSNEKALKIIEQQYKSFIDQQDKWGFFHGLAEYIKTVQELTETKPFITALEKQRQTASKVYELMNSQAMTELRKSAERVTEIAQKIIDKYKPALEKAQKAAEKMAEKAKPAIKAVEVYQNDYDRIASALKEVHDQLNGHILSSNPLYALDSDLFGVARQIRASGHEAAIKEFEDDGKKVTNIYGNYTFSPTYEKIDEEKRKLERKGQVEPWGAWHEMPLVQKLVFEPDEITDELRATVASDPSARWTWLNFIGVLGEMEKIRSGEASDNDLVIFRVADYKRYAQRVHSYLVAELLQADAPTAKSDPRFDEESRILYFNNEKILIGKKEESDPHKLLRTLFKDKRKVWASDEVLEDWGYSFDDKVSANKVYQAGKAVNQTVAQDTKIKDFLVVSTKNININKAYLKK
ncbi:MAG: hypothetical protein RL641_896 [Candidatus Parcubacteria bacterium]|jgi:uncharacterized protein YlaN (UPF0358 family)